jgi:hypothetical protein
VQLSRNRAKVKALLAWKSHEPSPREISRRWSRLGSGLLEFRHLYRPKDENRTAQGFSPGKTSPGKSP